MIPRYSGEYPSNRAAQYNTERVFGIASELIRAGFVVAFEGGTYRLATHLDGKFSGMAVNVETKPGSRVEFVPDGLIELEDWTLPAGQKHLTPGANYFLTTGGVIGLTAPGTGYLIVVGAAVNETVLKANFPTKVNLGT